MNSYKFLLNGTQDITENILQFNYSESLDDVASSFDFTSLVDFGLTVNDELNNISLIDTATNNLVYFGYVTDFEHATDKNIYSYSGFDVGFYLNKNEVIKQFVDANVGDAIQSLCDEYQIKLDNKPVFQNTVSKIYKDVVFSDILKELLELEKTKGGTKNIYIDCKLGNLDILTYQKEPVLSSIIANNIVINSYSTITDVETKISIQDLKNKVIYSNNDEKSVYQVERHNQNSINSFGLLTSVETVDTNKNNNLPQLAQNKLDELNKPRETQSIKKMIADYRCSKGKVIDLNVSQYNLIGEYLITSVSHNIDSKKELVSFRIDKFNG